MAVAFDAVSTVASATGVSSFSWTHTPVGTPSAVGIGWAGYSGNGTARTHTVTYGGQACALEVGPDADPFANGRTNSIYGKGAPLTGAQTVLIADDGGSNNMHGQAYCVSVTGSDTSDVFSNSANASGSSTSSSVVCTSTADEIVLDACTTVDTGNCTVGSGQTQIINASMVVPFSFRALGSREGGAASVTMSWNFEFSTPWDICAASFRVASTGTEALNGSSSTSAQTAPSVGFTVAL
jgi:hypothetical protein